MVGIFGQEVAGDVISSQNVKTIEGYVVVNFEVTSCSSFQNIQTSAFCIKNGRRLNILIKVED